MGEFTALIGVFVLGVILGVNSSFKRVDAEEWQRAESYCATNEGIGRFVAKPWDDNSVECKNTAKFTLKSDKK